MGELRWQPLGAADSEETGREVQGESQRPEGKWIVCWRCDVPVGECSNRARILILRRSSRLLLAACANGAAFQAMMVLAALANANTAQQRISPLPTIMPMFADDFASVLPVLHRHTVFMRTRVPDPVLSLTVTATLRLDPSVLREALNPHSPAAAATLSTSESMKTLPSSSSLNSLASFTDPSADPGTFTEIDLLGGLAEGPYYPGEDQQNASGRSNLAHLPLSRFPARVLGARLSTPETGARDLAARTKSSFPAPPNAEPASASTAVQSEGRQEAGADVDGVRILRRSCRRVLDVRSAVQVRMRTVLAPSLPESIKGANSEQDNAFEQLRNGTASHALVLCVELENPSQSGLRFAVSSVRIEIAPPPAPPATASSSIGAKRDPRAEATLLQPEGRFPMILDQADQQNLLYYVQFEADELEIANAIGNSSAAGDAQRFVSIVVEGRPLLLGQTGDRNSSDEPDGHHTDGQSKTAGPAGSSSSEDEPHSYAPTAPFLSRWNCTLDLSPLRRALERERVFRAPLTTDPLEPHGKQDNVRSSWPATASNGALQAPASVIAGSVRHTASALARASATDAALAQRTNRALGPPRRPSSPPTTAGTGTTHRSSAPTPGAIADPNGRRGLAVPPTPNWARSPGRSSSNPSLPALGPAFMGAPLSSAALPLRSPSSPVTPRTGSWRTPSSAGLLAQSQARAASAQFANSRRESMSAYPGSGSESAYLHDTRRSSVPPEGQGPGTGDFRSPSAVRRDRSSVLGTSSVGGPQTPGWRDSIHRSLEDKNEILPWGTNTATAGAGAGAGRKEPPPPSPDQTALLVTLRVRPGPQDHDSFSKLNISSSSTEPTLMALQPFALEVLIFNRTYETRSLLLSWAGRNGSEDSNLMSANTDEWEMRPIQRSRLLDAEGTSCVSARAREVCDYRILTIPPWFAPCVVRVGAYVTAGARRKYADIKMAQRQASIVPLENHIQLG